MSQFVKQIEEEAQRAFKQNPKSLADPRMVYEQAMEKLHTDLSQANSLKKKKECEFDICHLYVSRAAMEINFKQNKKAKMVFDEAFKNDFCKQSNIVWKAFINFYIREKKIEAAKKYLREAVETVDVRLVYWLSCSLPLFKKCGSFGFSLSVVMVVKILQ